MSRAHRRAGRGKRARSGEPSVQGLVKDLVDQFSRPLDFYRELIQNSIDAGSNRIDVTLRHARGRAVIRVEDDGEGMDERIIDDYLLVLFASSKEGDFTKIGKFGIGFMSVFAPRPELVRVFTAKTGQSWRLEFPSYKRYEKYRATKMREGTLVELLKPMARPEYDALVKSSREAVKFWCRYSEAKIFFRDLSASPRRAAEEITEPFDLPSGHIVRYKEEGTEIVLGFSDERKPFYGFYNRGLTLKEGNKEFIPGVEFKAKSRYLEHTLTRDNVLEDENYSKLMALVERLAHTELPRRHRERLEDAAVRLSREDLPAGERENLTQAWLRGFGYIRARRGCTEWRIFPVLEGKPESEAEIAEGDQNGRLFWDTKPNEINRPLRSAGASVIREGPWVAILADLLKAQPVQASTAYIKPRVLARPPSEVAAFLKTLSDVDAAGPRRYRDILAADFRYEGSCIADAFFVTQRRPGELTEASERPGPSLFSLGPWRPSALLNAEHDYTRKLVKLHGRRPGLAAYLALKLLHLHDGEVPPEKRGEFCVLAGGLEEKLLTPCLALEAGLRASGREPAGRNSP